MDSHPRQAIRLGVGFSINISYWKHRLPILVGNFLLRTLGF